MTEPLNGKRLKIMVVGNKGIGKTTLVHKFCKVSHNEDKVENQIAIYSQSIYVNTSNHLPKESPSQDEVHVIDDFTSNNDQSISYQKS